MDKVSIISAYGATVGDNITVDIVKNFLEKHGYKVSHGYDPESVLAVYGPGGLIWDNTQHSIIKNAEKLLDSGIPCLGLSLGCQGISDYNRWMFLKRFIKVCVRDPYTLSIINRLGAKTVLTQDVGFLCDTGENRPEGDVLGVTTPNLTSYPDIAKALKSLSSKFKIRYIPFSIPEVEECRRVCREISGEIVDLYVGKPSIEQAMEISKCRIVLAGHLHAFIFALTSNTPCVVLPLRDKIRWMCSWLGYEEYLALAADEIESKVRLILKLEDEVKYWMAETVKEQKEKAYRNLQVLMEVLKDENIRNSP